MQSDDVELVELVAKLRGRANIAPMSYYTDLSANAALDKEAAAAIERLVAENHALTEALTPSVETKAAYIGEFSFNVEVSDPDGGDDGEGEAVMEPTLVPWTTVKEIMAAISARARQALGDT